MGRPIQAAEEKVDVVSIFDATRAAIESLEIPPSDLGSVAVLLRIARAIDDIDDDGLNPAGKLDNVSIPTYLRYAEALGLTPSGRVKLTPKAAAPTPAPIAGGAPCDDDGECDDEAEEEDQLTRMRRERRTRRSSA